MKFNFSKRSLDNFKEVSPCLVNLAHYVLSISRVDFVITEGLRTQERQNYLFSLGRSRRGKKVTWTQFSKHQEGKAIDFYPYPMPRDLNNPPIEYKYKQLYLRELFRRVSLEKGIKIKIISKDLPHIELLGG